jgi:hypothetical protein
VFIFVPWKYLNILNIENKPMDPTSPGEIQDSKNHVYGKQHIAYSSYQLCTMEITWYITLFVAWLFIEHVY